MNCLNCPTSLESCVRGHPFQRNAFHMSISVASSAVAAFMTTWLKSTQRQYVAIRFWTRPPAVAAGMAVHMARRGATMIVAMLMAVSMTMPVALAPTMTMVMVVVMPECEKQDQIEHNANPRNNEH
jgi:hypothetical protein